MSFSQSVAADPQSVSFLGSEVPGAWSYDDDAMSEESGASDGAEDPLDRRESGLKKPRNCSACLSCRRQKTRCEFTDGQISCKLCIRYNRECTKAPPRRRRQKTTVRIADLEQKIQNLTDALTRDSPTTVENRTGSGNRSQPASSMSQSARDLQFQRLAQPQQQRHQSQPQQNQQPERQKLDRLVSITPTEDFIQIGLLDQSTASACFDSFRKNQLQYFPFLVVPAHLDGRYYRRRKPVLYTAMVLAGISTIRPDLAPPLADHIMRTFADRILYRAERSLDIVQALLLYVCFYARSLDKKDLNFYQYIHSACTMALELGLGRRAGSTAKSASDLSEEDLLEARRTWLGCYYMAVHSAASLRHPSVLRWSVYIEECLDVFATSPHALPSDLTLRDITKITRIAEDAGNAFSMSDPGCIVPLRDPKTQYQLGALEKQLQRWRAEAATDAQSRYLHAATNLYIHEIALHRKHDVDNFRTPPYTDVSTQPFDDSEISPVRIDALCTCLESIHTMLDIFLEVDIDTLRCLPNLFFVRMGYSVVALKSLADIFESETWTNSRSQVPHVRFIDYIDRLINVLRRTGENGLSNISTSLAVALQTIKEVHETGKIATPVQQQQQQQHQQQRQPNLTHRRDSNSQLPASMTNAGPNSVQEQAFNRQPFPYVEQQTLPTDFPFKDFDITMFDTSAFQPFDPEMNIWDLSGMYTAGRSSFAGIM